MIECSNKIIFKKKNRNKKLFKILFGIFVFITCIVLLFEFIISPHIISISLDYAESVISKSINECIVSHFSKMEYNDLIVVEKDYNGDITFMSVNSVKINECSRIISCIINDRVDSTLKSGVDIPFFAILGIKGLSGYGRNIKIKTLSIIKTECKLSSKFTSAGINQTIHSIYADISCTVKINSSINKKESVINSNILLSENILIGKIPNIYLTQNPFVN